MKYIDYNLPIFTNKEKADLNQYSNEMANAIKAQIDKFGDPLIFKGTVETLEELKYLTDVKNGYIYTVISEEKNYIYNGTEWVVYSNNESIQFEPLVVAELPEVGKDKVLYLVPNSKQAENNIYDEYIYVNNNWEIVGSTAIDPENLKDSVPIGAIIEYDGDTVPDGYEEVEENEIIVSPTEPTGNNRKKVWMQKGKNLFNKNDAQIANNLGKYQMNGTVQYNTDYTYLKLSYKEEKQLTYSGCNNASGVNVIIFNFYKDTTFLSQSMFTSSSGTITIPSTCNNFTFSFPYADKETVQIESGNVSTEHEEYIEPKIYVKNGNDVYEEFMKKEESLLEIYELLASVNNEDKTITLSNNKLSNYKFLIVSSGYGTYKSITAVPVSFLKYLGSSGKLCNQCVKTYNGYGFTSISYVDDTSFKINGAVITDSNATDTTTFVYGVK